MPAWTPDPMEADRLEKDLRDKERMTSDFYLAQTTIIDHYLRLKAQSDEAREVYYTYMGWTN